MTVLETQRLLLREFEMSDANNLYLLNSDPEVLQYTGDRPFSDITEAKMFIQNYNHYEQYGFGRWAVVLRRDNLFIGWCGIKYTPKLDEYDIGFRFFKKYWGNGYATEAAQACLDYAYESLNLEEIVCRAVKKNTASLKVLEKIGLQYFTELDFDGLEGVQYVSRK